MVVYGDTRGKTAAYRTTATRAEKRAAYRTTTAYRRSRYKRRTRASSSGGGGGGGGGGDNGGGPLWRRPLWRPIVETRNDGVSRAAYAQESVDNVKYDIHAGCPAGALQLAFRARAAAVPEMCQEIKRKSVRNGRTDTSKTGTLNHAFTPRYVRFKPPFHRTSGNSSKLRT